MSLRGDLILRFVGGDCFFTAGASPRPTGRFNFVFCGGTSSLHFAILWCGAYEFTSSALISLLPKKRGVANATASSFIFVR